jgi:hypothetical protein
MTKFLLHPDLNSCELMAGATLVRVDAEGFDTDDPAVIAALDAYPSVYRDGTVPTSPVVETSVPVVEPVNDPGKGKAGKS